ncbi:hypothetical protein D3C74_243070 [compost metagenome]
MLDHFKQIGFQQIGQHVDGVLTEGFAVIPNVQFQDAVRYDPAHIERIFHLRPVTNDRSN